MHEARPQALLPVLFYLSALFPGRRLFPPVEQHSQHAAAGGQHQADPQRHIAAVPSLGAAGSRCRDGFSLHIFTDRTAALSGTFFGLGGLFGYFPIKDYPKPFFLTVAPFSGFVQVALAPISQKLCGAPAPIRIFRGNHGEIPLISLDPDSLGLSPESPTPVPKAFHLRKGHSTCHPPLRTGVYQTRNCRYPLAPSQM